MFICKNPKFVYVSFTKSGSSTLYNILRKNFKGIEKPRHHKKIPEQFTNYPSFCVVRNPYSRMVSWWWAICKSQGDRYGHKRELRQKRLPESLYGFLQLWKTKKGLSQYTGIERNGKFDWVLKIENIENDFNNLPFISKHILIPKKNSRKHPTWQELIDTKSGKLINEIYQKDFEEFDYEMLEFE